jgi:hypothetical protein
MIVAYVIGYLYMIGIVFQYVSATVACRDRLLMIREKFLLRYHLSAQEVKIYVDLSRKIFKIVHHINNDLTFPLIICFLLLLIDVTFEFYGVVRTYLKSTETFLLLGISGLVWVLAELYPIFITIYFAESFWSAVEGVKEVGYEILCHHRIFEPNSEKIFSYFIRSIEKQTLQMRTIFFNLDWKLFFEVKNF